MPYGTRFGLSIRRRRKRSTTSSYRGWRSHSDPVTRTGLWSVRSFTRRPVARLEQDAAHFAVGFDAAAGHADVAEVGGEACGRDRVAVRGAECGVARVGGPTINPAEVEIALGGEAERSIAGGNCEV